MTVIEWQDFIKDRISRIDKTLEIDKREVKKAMDIVFKQIIYDNKDNNDMIDTLSHTFTSVAVTYDADIDKYVAEYPATPIFVNNSYNLCIRFVTYDGSEDIDFCPVTESDIYLLEGQTVDLVDDVIPYTKERDRIVFWDGIDDGSEILTTGVKIKMLIPISEMENTDEMFIPDKGENDFIMMVLNIMGITQPQT